MRQQFSEQVSLMGSNAIILQNSTGALKAQVGMVADSDGAQNGLYVVPQQEMFNGSTWDRVRNNTQGTLLASAARTGTATSPNQTNYNAKGLQIILDVTAASGTGGLTVILKGIDPVTGKVFNINVPPAAITAIGTYIYEIYPGVGGAGGNVNQRTSGIVPRQFNVVISHGDGSSYTYSVGYSLIL